MRRLARIIIRTLIAVLVIGIVAAFLVPAPWDVRLATGHAIAGWPHQRYAGRLRLQRVIARLPGSGSFRRLTGVTLPLPDDIDAWLQSAELALASSTETSPSFTRQDSLDRPGAAIAWRFPARLGHRIVVTGTPSGDPPFVDLFEARPAASPSGEQDYRHLASASSGETGLTYDVRADGFVVLRVQHRLGSTGEIRIEQRSEPSVLFPVRGLTPRAIHSRFGAQRDAGRRSHEGIDIFAARGTPVVAATAGWVGNSLENGLGGNVVWVWNPGSGVRTYYAHLDRHGVSPGQRVQPGDVLGYVGNTGNARGGPPHLHFGIYLGGSGSVDPLPFVCGADCDS